MTTRHKRPARGAALLGVVALAVAALPGCSDPEPAGTASTDASASTPVTTEDTPVAATEDTASAAADETTPAAETGETAEANPGGTGLDDPVGSFAGAELVVSRWAGDPWETHMRDMGASWGAVTGGTVTIDAVPYSNLQSKQALDLAGTGDMDIMQVQALWFGDFVDAGYLLELDDYIDDPSKNPEGYGRDSWIEGALEMSSANGHIYCLPDFLSAFVVAYRTDVFEEAGLEAPKTLDDVLAAAEQLNGYNGMYGIAIPGKASGSPFETLSAMIEAQGTWWFDASGKPSLDVEKTAKALDYYQKLAEFAPPGVLDYHVDEIGVAAQQGTIAMAISSTPSFFSTEAEGSPTKGKWAYVPIAFEADNPGGMITYWQWCVSSKSDNPDAAYSFIQWYTNGRQQVQVALNGGTTGATKDFYDSAEAKAGLPYFDALQEALAGAPAMPNLSGWPKIQDDIQIEIQAVLQGTKTPEEAAQSMLDILEAGLGG
ncbi:MAG: sugar ABC transporter substrate-binding protein [Bifidobacteriaceae bacterium]|jgi:ABC-type glycerol-3-phosphate transport system substrate-binding protein|nr:sugar ABC transporter substrate-binding protein [Bifidobacteriaceae bacterium]